ncbi:ATP-grasp domain-containing protein [Prosthecobacter dejongeii]|uniref:ATP-grasp domain-containing protein n=1 Tax=Prosthecobacter dejongeii TaxID=48465 RepID=A0A7W7YMT7_9BACT|nr:ATP-grasp domain-containing protein [Prosthecobacter dejongeii]MBB5038969.1 hypothetical protein [Prosthecobacter dejongeii]
MNSSAPLLLLAPRITEDSISMWKAALALGWSAQRIQGWRVPEELVGTDRPIVIYGEPLFAEAVADQLGLVILEPAIDWLTSVPREYLQRDIEIMPLARARAFATKAFVKPADGKIFDPKVYESGNALPGDDQVDADIPVLRSGVVDFRLEVRCFIRAREIVTLSPYWREDALAHDEQGEWLFLPDEEAEARDFAGQVLGDDRIKLPPACTLDVGRLDTGTWAIIEANPCWGAGLYGCDPQTVLETLRAAILPRRDITAEHRPWISARRQMP